MEATLETRPFLNNPHTYSQYAFLVACQVAIGKTTGLEQTTERINYTRLNSFRSKRVEKTFEMLPALKTAITRITDKWEWILLTESWCGDGAQLVPAIAAVAAVTPKIELTILLRDENPELMHQYLTNGSLAIPKLICFDATTGEELFTWGPRPTEIQEKVLAYKAANPACTKEELHVQLAIWYAKDKGQALQKDLLKKIKKTTAGKNNSVY